MKGKPTNNFIIMISIVLSFFGIIYLYDNTLQKTITQQSTKKEYIIINRHAKSHKDNRYDDDEDGPGRRFYSNRINIRTRGQPDEYQTVGILRDTDSDKVLPLMGRKTYPGSNHWNYFTMTDSHLKTEIPIKFKQEKQNYTIQKGRRYRIIIVIIILSLLVYKLLIT